MISCFFFQSILTDHYFHRKDLLVVSLGSPSSVKNIIQTTFTIKTMGSCLIV